jgi:hypothetical protein
MYGRDSGAVQVRIRYPWATFISFGLVFVCERERHKGGVGKASTSRQNREYLRYLIRYAL